MRATDKRIELLPHQLNAREIRLDGVFTRDRSGPVRHLHWAPPSNLNKRELSANVWIFIMNRPRQGAESSRFFACLRWTHSQRRAIIGSTFVARRAGT